MALRTPRLSRAWSVLTQQPRTITQHVQVARSRHSHATAAISAPTQQTRPSRTTSRLPALASAPHRAPLRGCPRPYPSATSAAIGSLTALQAATYGHAKPGLNRVRSTVVERVLQRYNGRRHSPFRPRLAAGVQALEQASDARGGRRTHPGIAASDAQALVQRRVRDGIRPLQPVRRLYGNSCTGRGTDLDVPAHRILQLCVFPSKH